MPLQSQLPCPEGTFQDEVGRSFCKTNEPGYTEVEQTNCPAGFECPSATEDIKIACNYGEYSKDQEKSCQRCPAGFKCPEPDEVPVACEAGTISTGGLSYCMKCPAGFECLDTTGNNMRACRKGEYYDDTTGKCVTCPAGKACPHVDQNI